MQSLAELVDLVRETERALAGESNTADAVRALDRWDALQLGRPAEELFRASADPEEATLQYALSRSLYETAGHQVGALVGVTLAMPDGGVSGGLFRALAETAHVVGDVDRLRALAEEAQKVMRQAEFRGERARDMAEVRMAGAQAEAARERAATVVIDVGLEAALRGYREGLATSVFSDEQNEGVRNGLLESVHANVVGGFDALRTALHANVCAALRAGGSENLVSALPSLLAAGAAAGLAHRQAVLAFGERFAAYHLAGISPFESAFRTRRTLAYEAETNETAQAWLLRVAGVILTDAEIAGLARRTE